MHIEEIQKLRRVLAKNILVAVKEFETLTNTHVSSIRLTEERLVGEDTPRVVNVEIGVEL